MFPNPPEMGLGELLPRLLLRLVLQADLPRHGVAAVRAVALRVVELRGEESRHAVGEVMVMVAVPVVEGVLLRLRHEQRDLRPASLQRPNLHPASLTRRPSANYVVCRTHSP